MSQSGRISHGSDAYGNYNIEDTADFTVYVPKADPLFMASLAVVPLQLLAYYVQWGGDWMSTSRAIWPKALR